MRVKLKDFKGGLFTGKKPTPLVPSERLVSKSIEEWLTAHRIYNDRINSGMVEAVKKAWNKQEQRQKEYRQWIHLAKKGTPDRFFIISGKIYFVEVKKPGGQLSDDQITRHAELRKNGCTIFVADSIDSFIAQFNEHFSKGN